MIEHTRTPQLLQAEALMRLVYPPSLGVAPIIGTLWPLRQHEAVCVVGLTMIYGWSRKNTPPEGGLKKTKPMRG